MGEDKRSKLLRELLREEIMHLFDVHRNEILESYRRGEPYADACIAFYERYIKNPRDARIFALFKNFMKEYFDAREEVKGVYDIENLMHELSGARRATDEYWDRVYWETVGRELAEGDLRGLERMEMSIQEG